MVIKFVFRYHRVELLCTLRIACELELGETSGTETHFGLLKSKKPKQIARILNLEWIKTDRSKLGTVDRVKSLGFGVWNVTESKRSSHVETE